MLLGFATCILGFTKCPHCVDRERLVTKAFQVYSVHEMAGATQWA